jgi:hypothetical protein
LSLNNQSGRLSDLRLREEALAAIEETVTIRRQLAYAWPQVYLAPRGLAATDVLAT